MENTLMIKQVCLEVIQDNPSSTLTLTTMFQEVQKKLPELSFSIFKEHISLLTISEMPISEVIREDQGVARMKMGSLYLDK